MMTTVVALDLATGLTSVEREQEAYRLRQERLRCEAHPDQGCLTRPGSEGTIHGNRFVNPA
jgi:hypothetical protein